MKSVVIYFSLEGNTHLVAKMIAERTGADLIRLEPEKEYQSSGFGKYFHGGKSVLFHEKPKLLNEDLNLNDYDTIIIGTPIWAGSFTPPINTFLSENMVKDKSIFLFVTNKGGDTEKCFAKMKEKLTRNQIKGTAKFNGVNKMSAKELDDRVRKFCQTFSN